MYISARSLGEVNVQVIVEALGGGGNSTTAGGQLNVPDIAVARTALLRAIDEYFENKKSYDTIGGTNHESDFAEGYPGQG